MSKDLRYLRMRDQLDNQTNLLCCKPCTTLGSKVLALDLVLSGTSGLGKQLFSYIFQPTPELLPATGRRKIWFGDEECQRARYLGKHQDANKMTGR